MKAMQIKLIIDLDNGVEVEALHTFMEAVGKKEYTQTLKKVEEIEVVEAAEVKAEAPVKKEETKEETVEEAPKEETVEEAPKEEKAGAEEVQSEEPKVSIIEIRALVSEKVTDSRQAIKDKLAEYEAMNVTNLDPKHYDEFHKFLVEL
jgi:hypothetical protein